MSGQKKDHLLGQETGFYHSSSISLLGGTRHISSALWTSAFSFINHASKTYFAGLLRRLDDIIHNTWSTVGA